MGVLSLLLSQLRTASVRGLVGLVVDVASLCGMMFCCVNIMMSKHERCVLKKTGIMHSI